MTLSVILFFLGLSLAAVTARGRLLSFRAQKPEDYAATGPEFDIRKVLDGPIRSEGLIYGPNGRMTNSFITRMHGSWEGSQGTLTEDFTYSNGKRLQRKWFLSLGTGGQFTARAADIEGTAEGTVSGSTVQLRYRIRLPEDAGGHILDTTDWMYLMQDGSIMNRSEMRKFGVKVAELVATMRPDEAATDQRIAAE